MHAALEREAHALARLSHPNVVQIHDLVLTDDGAFVVREYVDGAPLDAWLKSPRTPRRVREVFAQAARGLAATHDAERWLKLARVAVDRSPDPLEAVQKARAQRPITPELALEVARLDAVTSPRR